MHDVLRCVNGGTMADSGGSNVERAASVLFAVARGEEGRTVRELAESLGLSKSAAQRILAALERTGLLAVDDASGRYVRGPRLIELAARIAQPLVAVEAVARPVLLELLRQTDETVALHTAVGDERMILLQFESSQPLRYAGSPEQLYPIDRGAASRALVAAREPGAARSVILSRGERVDGIVGIAVPVRAEGTALSVGLSIPATRADRGRLDGFVPLLEHARDELEARLASRA